MYCYVQESGNFYDSTGALVAECYAGGFGGGVNAQYKNNPAAQNLKGLGPLPCGFYTIGPLFNDPETGPASMRLTPDPDNEMFGRGGFLIHPDSIARPGTASEGCIAMEPESARVAVSKSGDDRLQVVATEADVPAPVPAQATT
jgi:hypothetical protein